MDFDLYVKCSLCVYSTVCHIWGFLSHFRIVYGQRFLSSTFISFFPLLEPPDLLYSWTVLSMESWHKWMYLIFGTIFCFFKKSILFSFICLFFFVFIFYCSELDFTCDKKKTRLILKGTVYHKIRNTVHLFPVNCTAIFSLDCFVWVARLCMSLIKLLTTRSTDYLE